MTLLRLNAHPLTVHNRRLVNEQMAQRLLRHWMTRRFNIQMSIEDEFPGLSGKLTRLLADKIHRRWLQTYLCEG